jgi:2-polyprenyl-3-methyl-5-hydroxy-6-metoxy-1,4-benzoquinol methylase
MSCCSGKGCDEFFDERVARRDARRYSQKGLDRNARRIVELVGRRGIEGKTVLEVGGGVGAIQLELLQAGVARTVNVELSPAYEPYAAELLRVNGLDARVDRRVLDFAERAEELESVDVVVLHRVVCCYPDYETLVGAAADHARDQLLLSFPRDAWWTRLGLGTINRLQRLRRRTFRVYLHAPAKILEVANSHGVEIATREHGRIWELVSLERSTSQA